MTKDVFEQWWAERTRATRFAVARIPFDELTDWHFAAESGNLGHASGRFFTIEGLRISDGERRDRYQPVVVQSEIGILGILARQVDGVRHLLMQAKMEPGNVNVLQLSPTVQATRSNYTRVHKGAGTRYLDYFRSRRGRTLVDVLQSEQGEWFWHKRNRNMVIEVDEDVPEYEEFRWLPERRVRQLLQVDNLVNMDARSVLSCVPPERECISDSGPFGAALAASYERKAPSRHGMDELLAWFTDVKSRCTWTSRPVPLAGLPGWSRTIDEIGDEDGERFNIVAVRVHGNREVRDWTQPLLAPRGTATSAFLARQFDGVLHVLVRGRPEPGLMEMVEMAPTVQLPAGHGIPVDEPYAGLLAAADPGRLQFDTVLSEEGGRFYQALTRYAILEVGEQEVPEEPPDFRWVTAHQLTELLRHGHYLTVQARSLLSCLHSLL